MRELAPSGIGRLASRELRGASIGSAALAVPGRVVHNAPIAERLGVEEQWIEVRTGIKQRRNLADGERLSDLAALAGERALADAGVDPADVDLLVVATTTQDEITPNTAPLVATELGAVNAAAFDVGAACTAFVTALQVATAQVESGRADTALVIGADALSRFLDQDDRRTAALFGDGAGAIVMSASDEGRVGPIALRSEAQREMIICARGGKLSMQGHETFVNAVKRMSEITLEVLDRAGLETGRRGPVRLPPGQPAHPRRPCRAPRSRRHARGRLHRGLRQHVGRLDTDRPGGGPDGGPAHRRRARAAGRLRRRLHLGRSDRGMGA